MVTVPPAITFWGELSDVKQDIWCGACGSHSGLIEPEGATSRRCPSSRPHQHRPVSLCSKRYGTPWYLDTGVRQFTPGVSSSGISQEKDLLFHVLAAINTRAETMLFEVTLQPGGMDQCSKGVPSCSTILHGDYHMATQSCQHCGCSSWHGVRSQRVWLQLISGSLDNKTIAFYSLYCQM